MSNQYKHQYAVVDRISEGLAVLLVGPDEREVAVDFASLPDGAKEGDWLKLDSNGNFATAPDITSEKKVAIRNKLDKLRNRQKT